MQQPITDPGKLQRFAGSIRDLYSYFGHQLKEFSASFQALAASKMNTQPVIMSQPQVVVVQHQSPQWQTDLFDCFSDCGVCLCGTFLFLCLGCQVASDMDECCLCGPTMAMRSVYRTKYGIPGSLLGDYFAVCCCPHCSLCQLKRDINKRKDMGIF